MKLFSTRLIWLTYVCVPLIVAVSCKKDDPAPPTVPAVTTTPLTNITTSSATTGGTILTNGNAVITKSGIVWSKTNATPTLTDSIIASTAVSGSFTTNLTGLDFNTEYYIRAFATNSVGTGYGDVVKLTTTNDTSKVRFTYNGKEVIYGIIISPATGKKWLDRNLGASQVATAADDYKAYGDLFQWGRPADGHQLINWTSSTAGVAVNGMTNVLATSDNPGHSNWIDAITSSAGDWRSDNNANRWAINPQGPCPAGWHVPTRDEWTAEISQTSGGTATSGGITNRSTAFSELKLTLAGFRRGPGDEVGQFARPGNTGYYWSSSVSIEGTSNLVSTLSNGSFATLNPSGTSIGACIRCLTN